MTQLHDLARAQAMPLLDYVLLRDQLRLVDLAHHLHATGGPLEEMDATPESLVPLWIWYGRQAASDFPGVAEDAMPGIAMFLGAQPYPAARGQYVAEAMSHYFLRVIQRFHPDAHWALFPLKQDSRIRSTSDNDTIIVWDNEKMLMASDSTIRNFATHTVDGQVFPDTKLLNIFERGLRMPEGSASAPRGPSILTPLLAEAPAPADDPRRQVPVAVLPEPDPAPVTPAVSVELTMHSRFADEEFTARTPPLNERKVIETLSRLGARSVETDEPVGREIKHGGEYVIGDDVLLITAFSAKGRLRALAFETALATIEEWNVLEPELVKLAAATHSVLRDEQE